MVNKGIYLKNVKDKKVKDMVFCFIKQYIAALIPP